MLAYVQYRTIALQLHLSYINMLYYVKQVVGSCGKLALDGVCRGQHLERAIAESRRGRATGRGVAGNGAPMVEGWENSRGQTWGADLTVQDPGERSLADSLATIQVPGRGFIYAIVNRLTHRIYVGHTTRTVRFRLGGHRNALRYRRHANSQMRSDWNEWGQEAFCCELLGRITPDDDGRAMELAWMQILEKAGASLYNVLRTY